MICAITLDRGSYVLFFMLIVFPLNSPSLFAQSELPLVGNVAPDFEAEAVYDQEFIKVVYQ